MRPAILDHGGFQLRPLCCLPPTKEEIVSARLSQVTGQVRGVVACQERPCGSAGPPRARVTGSLSRRVCRRVVGANGFLPLRWLRTPRHAHCGRAGRVPRCCHNVPGCGPRLVTVSNTEGTSPGSRFLPPAARISTAVPPLSPPPCPAAVPAAIPAAIPLPLTTDGSWRRTDAVPRRQGHAHSRAEGTGRVTSPGLRLD